MPCATPPWIWPSTIKGLITRPQSWTTTYRLISTCAVSGSTSTTIACTPFAVLPRSGPKYAVASRPGSVPGRTAPRSGFALSASAPSATPRRESPRRCTRPPSRTRSAAAAPSSRLASSSTFSRTATAAAEHALPATTAPRPAQGAATGEGARTPVELSSVARDHVHVRHVHAQDLGHDLSEDGKVALSLRPHPRRQSHAAARLDGDPRALVRPDPRPLDVAHDADPYLTPRRFEPRLLLPHEARIVDGLERLVQ